MTHPHPDAPAGDLERDTLVLQITAQQGNLNAAMMLLDTVPDDYTPRLVRILTPIYGKMERHWKCVIMPNVAGDEFGATHPDPARAILMAWRQFSKAAAAVPGSADAGDNGGGV